MEDFHAPKTAEWTANVAMVVEGVLKPYDDTNPIMSGVLLYKSLVKLHRVTLVLDHREKASTQHWLKMSGLIDHAAEVYYEVGDPEDVAERRDYQVKRMKQSGPLSYIIESDPYVVEKMLETGVPAFLYVHPEYRRPEHRPGMKEELTSWDSLMATVMREKELRANDARLHEF